MTYQNPLVIAKRSSMTMLTALLTLSLVISPVLSSQDQTNALVGDHVSMTEEAAKLRSKHLAKKKPLLKKKDSINSILFPGTTPEEYKKGDRIPVFVELVESRKTQLPINYFHIPKVCREPSKKEIKQALENHEYGNVAIKAKRKNLGQRLISSEGTKLVSYKIVTMQDATCTTLCQSMIEPKQIKILEQFIDKQYRVHFTLDSLPVLVRSKTQNYSLRGFPLGFKQSVNDGTDAGNIGEAGSEGKHKNDKYYVYNHLRFVIYYHGDSDDDDKENVQITGFDVVPVSIDQDITSCDTADTAIANKKEQFLSTSKAIKGTSLDVVYSYEVQWVKSSVEWADRWDIYMMETPDNEIHYFAIVNSLMIGFLLTSIVAVIMLKALRKDIAKYNDLNDVSILGGSDEDAHSQMMMEESGWKLVHGDVFRPPVRGRTLLSVFVGTGLQIGVCIFLTLIAAALRLLNPMRKGQTLSYIVVLYVLSGSVAGYSSARLYKFFCGKGWKRTTFLTATAFPGILFSTFVALNFFLHVNLGKAFASASFWTMLLMFVLWVCVSAPLVFVGAFFGYKADKIQVPTKTTQIARFVPETNSWFVKFPHCALLAGILPFASVCIELSFIMNALWINQIYYIMGFISIVYFVFTLSCSTMAMVMCYCQLCNEDHRWWWKSFLNGASTGVYLFVYSIGYLYAKLELVGVMSVVVYISYMGLICFAFSLYCGGVGLASSFWFCRKIYAAVKVD